MSRAITDAEVETTLRTLSRAIKNVEIRKSYIESCLPFADGLAYTQDKDKIRECSEQIWVYQDALNRLKRDYPWINGGQDEL